MRTRVILIVMLFAFVRVWREKQSPTINVMINGKLSGSIELIGLPINILVGDGAEAPNTRQKYSCCWGRNPHCQLYPYLTYLYSTLNHRRYPSKCCYKRNWRCSDHTNGNHLCRSGHCCRKSWRQSLHAHGSSCISIKQCMMTWLRSQIMTANP